MDKYFVSFNCIFSIEVEAESPEEAADLASLECPLDIDGVGYVENLKTGESYDI